MSWFACGNFQTILYRQEESRKLWCCAASIFGTKLWLTRKMMIACDESIADGGSEVERKSRAGKAAAPPSLEMYWPFSYLNFHPLSLSLPHFLLGKNFYRKTSYTAGIPSTTTTVHVCWWRTDLETGVKSERMHMCENVSGFWVSCYGLGGMVFLRENFYSRCWLLPYENSTAYFLSSRTTLLRSFSTHVDFAVSDHDYHTCAYLNQGWGIGIGIWCLFKLSLHTRLSAWSQVIRKSGFFVHFFKWREGKDRKSKGI